MRLRSPAFLLNEVLYEWEKIGGADRSKEVGSRTKQQSKLQGAGVQWV